MISRRALLAGGALALAGSASPARLSRAADKSFLPQGLPEGVYDTAALEALPGKKPLIKLVYRPPNYETPLSYFTSEFTPNDSFFVRYHLAGIPEEIDPAQWAIYAQISTRWKSPPSASAQATGADFRSRMCPACNGVSARWGMHSGRARG
jgi:hypothetical protein